MVSAKFNFKNLYFYIVCLISLIIFIVGAVQGVRNLLDIVYPDPQGPWVYERFEGRVEKGEFTEEEAEKKVEEYIQLEREASKIRNIKDLAQNIVMIVIAIPLFLIHWRRVSNLE